MKPPLLQLLLALVCLPLAAAPAELGLGDAQRLIGQQS